MSLRQATNCLPSPHKFLRQATNCLPSPLENSYKLLRQATNGLNLPIHKNEKALKSFEDAGRKYLNQTNDGTIPPPKRSDFF